MASILDYVKWRGDISLERESFNLLDNLVFAKLTYINFESYVAPVGEYKEITIKDFANEFFKTHKIREKLSVVAAIELTEMLYEMSKSIRYSNMKLSNFVNNIDIDSNKQFAALTIDTGDGSYLISFRGTDDSIVGWKEDFLMSCHEKIPAQTEAIEYFCMIARMFPDKTLRLTGHSKGGNLALYSAINCPLEVQDRIIAVYNNDGLGFNTDILESEGRKRLDGKVFSLVPEFCFIGMLMKQENDRLVVKSNKKGLYQHDGFSWEVDKNNFVTVDKVSEDSVELNNAIIEFFETLSVDEREVFVNNIFNSLINSGVINVKDLQKNKLKSLRIVLDSLKGLDKQSKSAFSKVIRLIFKTYI